MWLENARNAEMALAWIMPVLCFQDSMGFPGPGIFLVPSPTGLVRKVMRRATLVPARKGYQKVSTADMPSPVLDATVPTREGHPSHI